MTTAKTAISINEALFEKVEELAQDLNVSRSRLFAVAMEEFLRRHENRELLEAINRAYADGPDAEERAWLTAATRKQRRMSEAEW